MKYNLTPEYLEKLWEITEEDKKKYQEAWSKTQNMRPGDIISNEINPRFSQGALKSAERTILGMQPTYYVTNCNHDSLSQNQSSYLRARVRYYRILFNERSFGKEEKTCCAIEKAEKRT